MNEIQKERLLILEEATRRMRESDFESIPFASNGELIKLLQTEANWRKELKSGRILQFIKDPQEREAAERENKVIEANNKRIIDTYIKPLEFKIKVLEVEMMLFEGMFQMSETAVDIHKSVYPDDEDRNAS